MCNKLPYSFAGIRNTPICFVTPMMKRLSLALSRPIYKIQRIPANHFLRNLTVSYGHLLTKGKGLRFEESFRKPLSFIFKRSSRRLIFGSFLIISCYLIFHRIDNELVEADFLFFSMIYIFLLIAFGYPESNSFILLFIVLGIRSVLLLL